MFKSCRSNRKDNVPMQANCRPEEKRSGSKSNLKYISQFEPNASSPSQQRVDESTDTQLFKNESKEQEAAKAALAETLQKKTAAKQGRLKSPNANRPETQTIQREQNQSSVSMSLVQQENSSRLRPEQQKYESSLEQRQLSLSEASQQLDLARNQGDAVSSHPVLESADQYSQISQDLAFVDQLLDGEQRRILERRFLRSSQLSSGLNTQPNYYGNYNHFSSPIQDDACLRTYDDSGSQNNSNYQYYSTQIQLSPQAHSCQLVSPHYESEAVLQPQRQQVSFDEANYQGTNYVTSNNYRFRIGSHFSSAIDAIEPASQSGQIPVVLSATMHEDEYYQVEKQSNMSINFVSNDSLLLSNHYLVNPNARRIRRSQRLKYI